MSDQEVTTTTIDILTLVTELDDQHYENETVYEFSNGRKFESSDKSDSGVYE